MSVDRFINIPNIPMKILAVKTPKTQPIQCEAGDNVTGPRSALERKSLQPPSGGVSAQYVTFAGILLFSGMLETASISKRSYSDQSVKGYVTERTCWWNEVCKEEFQTLFRCKCPSWSYCRSPGRYYNAVCSMTETGYIWDQPNSEFRPQ
ncbi:hypothetical protein MSG28_008715 [Choristoneura fumiferana]|uniref:Uncharacterized protein n=1 Tax=Choristoneura fumiferana TaxID=7141 RepID=A0ACC0J7Q4_CHOFU|nr:hypothetical protein MSG28_008715 [Choristoneura fumiferana]